jgi:hypothetical protein
MGAYREAKAKFWDRMRRKHQDVDPNALHQILVSTE